ncbi:MAG: hypothetical protein LBB18_02590 [Puniceicoccales bacterium]|jgi:chromosome segregation ATPase|nr:hypothetical protein [Puniceicoccales bacterium]
MNKTSIATETKIPNLSIDSANVSAVTQANIGSASPTLASQTFNAQKSEIDQIDGNRSQLGDKDVNILQGNINGVLRERDHLQAELDKANVNINQKAADLEKLNGDHTKLYTAYMSLCEQSELTIQILEKKVESLEERINNFQTEISEKSTEIAKLRGIISESAKVMEPKSDQFASAHEAPVTINIYNLEDMERTSKVHDLIRKYLPQD